MALLGGVAALGRNSHRASVSVQKADSTPELTPDTHQPKQPNDRINKLRLTGQPRLESVGRIPRVGSGRHVVPFAAVDTQLFIGRQLHLLVLDQSKEALQRP